MLEFEKTIVTKFEYYVPERARSISGGCNISVSIGMPEQLESDSYIKCRIEVLLDNTKTEDKVLSISTVSLFRIIDFVSKESLEEEINSEGIAKALGAVESIIEETTKQFGRSPVRIPLRDNYE